ncbi:hypothetical protein MTO96_024864 [Rhipicephalus appendiculatus]
MDEDLCRFARTEAVNIRRENAVFLHASRLGKNSFVATVVDMSGHTVTAASVRSKSLGVADQVAISLGKFSYLAVVLKPGSAEAGPSATCSVVDAPGPER